jgi:hypothetical protein
LATAADAAPAAAAAAAIIRRAAAGLEREGFACSAAGDKALAGRQARHFHGTLEDIKKSEFLRHINHISNHVF